MSKNKISNALFCIENVEATISVHVWGGKAARWTILSETCQQLVVLLSKTCTAGFFITSIAMKQCNLIANCDTIVSTICHEKLSSSPPNRGITLSLMSTREHDLHYVLLINMIFCFLVVAVCHFIIFIFIYFISFCFLHLWFSMPSTVMWFNMKYERTNAAVYLTMMTNSNSNVAYCSKFTVSDGNFRCFFPLHIFNIQFIYFNRVYRCKATVIQYVAVDYSSYSYLLVLVFFYFVLCFANWMFDLIKMVRIDSENDIMSTQSLWQMRFNPSFVQL